ncbi:hypothetical protein K431DRAFT_5536 [Polychaeton citri CBS 116435]|uniref:FHA domain-containing protein n=1 Tax=Polychaeton citri CBS 116435 TaxID=1314669 RepID=A0A9P4QK78_9PEZI|nr:hypothetical protein K431DRAFT_5536 [Polychaeton citri CBS 116435]
MPPNGIVRVRLVMSPSTQDPEFTVRTIDLVPGSPLVLGRASASDASQQAKRDNTLFGCPVVSRKHAQLTADVNPWAGVNSVTIKELGSTHGTFINGERLPEGEIRTLYSGDQIKLGDRVMNGSISSSSSSLFLPSPSTTATDSLEGRHDGVIFEYSRVYDEKAVESRQTAQNRGYYVPSDNEYDFSSEDEDGELAELTPHTTPEQPRHSISTRDGIKGSQAMPIEIEAAEADEVPTSELPGDHQNQVSGNCDQDTLLVEDDEVDADHVSEYGDLSVLDNDLDEFSESDSFHGHEDALSASDASDLQSSLESLHDEDGGDEVEWGNDPEETVPVQDLTPAIVSPELSSAKQQSTMHYDPVRGSQPPAVSSTLEACSSQSQPDGSQGVQKPKSRWDMPPANPQADLFVESHMPYLYGMYGPELPLQNFNGVGIPPAIERDPYLLPADHMAFPQSPVFTYPLDTQTSTQGAGMSSLPAPIAGSDNKGETPSSKDRMSIPHIVGSQLSPSSKKRKAEDMSAEESGAAVVEPELSVTISNDDVVSPPQEQTEQQALSTTEGRPSKRMKAVATTAKAKLAQKEAAKHLRRAAASAVYYGTKAARVSAIVVKYSTVAAAGAVGMFAWLCSDQAEQLVSRLA